MGMTSFFRNFVSRRGASNTPALPVTPDVPESAVTDSWAASGLTSDPVPSLSPDGMHVSEPPDASASQEPTEPQAHNIVHDVLKGLDIGFGYQVAALQKEALQLAQGLAERGLPRHDLPIDEPLEAEVLLSQRARAIYSDWTRNARRRIEGAVAKQSQLMAAALLTGQGALERYRRAERQSWSLDPGAASSRTRTSEAPKNTSDNLRPIESGLPSDPATVEELGSTTDRQLTKRHLHRAFWPLTVLLVLAEFVANAPVFTELFPSNADIDRQVAQYFASDRSFVAFLGIKHVLVQLLAYPEPALLALSVVIFFLFLGHTHGAAWRTRGALRQTVPHVSEERRSSLRRENRLPLYASGVGIVLMLAVLFYARDTIVTAATERAQSAEQQFATAQAKLEVATKAPDKQQELKTAREDAWRAADEKTYRERRLDYASSIQRMNWPIAGLNLVLILTASVAGFYRHIVTITVNDTSPDGHAQQEHNDREALAIPRNLRLSALREEMSNSRQALGTSIGEAKAAYGKALQLLHAVPTKEWQGIVARLECAIPTFRNENARHRHLDTRDIRAFQRPANLNLAEPSFTIAAELSDRVAEQENDLQALVDFYQSADAKARSASRHDFTERTTANALTGVSS